MSRLVFHLQGVFPDQLSALVVAAYGKWFVMETSACKRQDADARRAMNEIDGREMDGRTLKVSEARPRENRGGRGRY